MQQAKNNRIGKATLAAGCAVALQLWPIAYQADLFGTHALGSLAHLHVGLLLALAMLFTDRIYLRAAFAAVLLTWVVRAYQDEYSFGVILLTIPNYVLLYAWTVWCARHMGWPRDAAQRQVGREDVARFALVGLLLYPSGWALMNFLVALTEPTWNLSGAINDTVQVFFAKHFGVSIVTLPLLLWCGERPRARDRFGKGDRMVWALLVLGLGVNLCASFVLHRDGVTLLATILDYRFALVAILTWCALRVSPRVVMPILIWTQLLLVFALAQATPRLEDVAGIFGLLKVAFELSVLQLLIVLLLIINRDHENLLEHLRDESQHEAITGLRNLNGLRAEVACMQPPPHEIAYLTLANLDRLAGGFGLRAQEALMQGTAAQLADCVESYHMGTGQFALLAKNAAVPIDWNGVLQRLERYDFPYAGESLRLTPYLGIAVLEGTAPEQIDAGLDAASTAAQDAALHGETAPVHARAALLQNTSSASRDALAVGSLALARVRAREIELYFQPIMRLDAPPDQPLQYAEILCRLRGADGALMLPNMFLRELEARARSSELDVAVIECLFRWLREHPRANLPRLGVNLTGRSVASESFRDILLGMLDNAPVAPSSLCFEITETEAIARFSNARRLLEQLRERGCHIALDDFGVGMQSFERLRELPFDIVKIDGSFVRGVVARARDYELVHASVAVAHACGADIVAEYVENAEIAACLRELGVPWGQGDYFGAAAPLAGMLRNSVAV